MIGIVIVSYRSDDRTVAFVQSQLSRVREPHRTVVVDNGATEEEAAALAARIPEAVVLPAENRGFAAGNNLGVRYLEETVRPSYILFANNDIEFTEEGVVETLVRTADAHPEAGALGPAVVGLDGNRQGPEPYQGLWKRYVWMYLCTPFLKASAKRRLFDLDYPEKAAEGPHYKLSGCFLLVRTADFLRVGGFDEGTFLYAEENILSDRFTRIGKVFYFVPSVSVLHRHGETIGASYDTCRRVLLQYDSMGYYYRSYRGCPRWMITLVRRIFTLILRIR
jgi:GT2 family glycosyltransferase